MTEDSAETIAVLGAGPIGLEAALYARYLGYEVALYEQRTVAQNVLNWGHVRMFTPWELNISSLGLAAILAQFGREFRPPKLEEHPTGAEWAERYLHLLAGTDLLGDSLRERHRILAVSREHFLKHEAPGSPVRNESQFRLLMIDDKGRERVEHAEYVLDCTGVYGQPNSVGAGGIPALGESVFEDYIDYHIPDCLGRDRAHFAGRHTLVVGSGYSAATVVCALAELATAEPGTRITWLTRRIPEAGAGPIARIEGDRLPARSGLAERANQVAAEGKLVEHLAGLRVHAVNRRDDRFVLDLADDDDEHREFTCDILVAHCGFHADDSLHRQLQIHLCYATGGPMRLASSLLAQSSVDCLDLKSSGPAALCSPEADYYILGAKSYGSNPHFLYLAGLNQIRDVFRIIAGRDTLDVYADIAAGGRR